VPPARSLGARTVRGVLWTYGSFAGVRLVTLASTAVLARLLSPRDFGLVALALIFTAALDSVRDLGLNEALIVSKDDDLAEDAETAFCFTVLMGAALALVVAGISPLAADFFHEPRLAALLVVLGLNLPLRSSGLTHYALAQRRMDFRSRTVAELVEVVVRAAAGVTLALAGLGAWSLVLGYLSGTLAWTAALWVSVAWRPSLRPRLRRLSSLLRFGGAVTVVGIIGTAMSYVDNLFVGRVLGPAALGLYSLGFRLPDVLIAGARWMVGMVLFPAFATLEGTALRRAVVVAFRYALLVGVPISVTLIALADPIVLAFFGPRWRDAAPVMQLLSLAYLGSPVAVTASAYYASRRVDVMVKIAVPQGLLLVALLAVFVDHGIVAVAGCQAAVRGLFVPIGLYVSTRVLGLRARDLWAAAWPALVAGAGMAAVLVAVERAIASPWPALLAGCPLGGAVYLGLVRLFAPDALPGLLRLARGGGR
jgi:O-antigen/teichoic acid export membrane protein